MKKIKDIAWIALGFAIIILLVYKIALNSFTDSFLGKNPQKTKAVIIDKKNFMGNQPVNPKFSYSYLFVINGHKYTGNAHDTMLKVGDTVDIEYNKEFPFINKPLHPRE